MQLQRLDDYQSWALRGVDAGGRAFVVAIDPWLTPEFHLPPARWMFSRRHEQPPAMTLEEFARVDAVVLTAHFGDHLDPNTLSVLPKATPIFANVYAARIVRKLGFTNVTDVKAGDELELVPGVRALAIAPGFPYRHNSIGFLFESGEARLYFETHVVDVPHLKRLLASRGPLSGLVIPAQEVRVALVPFVMSARRAARVVRALVPRVVMTTGDDPWKARGLLARTLVWARGTLEAFAEAMARESPATTRYVRARAGQVVDLALPGEEGARGPLGGCPAGS